MLLIVCALECEARPIIEHLSLKKSGGMHPFEAYEGRDLCLIISGVGAFKSAVATTTAISVLRKSTNDNSISAFNIGICGAKPQIKPGEVLLPHTIHSHSEKRRYFQELLIQHRFREVSMLTSPVPIFDPATLEYDCCDMEGYGFYAAASTFLKTSQIHCIKVVSDNCTERRLEKTLVSNIISANLGEILNYANRFSKAAHRSDPLSPAEQILLTELVSKLRFTSCQYAELEQLARSFKIRCRTDLSFLNGYMNNAPKHKEESRKTFQHLKQVLNAT